jgi:hypothetical protein
MTKRLATMCFMTVFLIGLSSPLIRAQDTENRRGTLKGISAILVIVETLPDGAKGLGLTEETIRTDVELKLRLAGMRAVTENEVFKLPGNPALYIRVTVTDSGEAAFIDLQLYQNVVLERNGQSALAVTTWSTGTLLSGPSSQGVRNITKDLTNIFLNAWLSVNPKK